MDNSLFIKKVCGLACMGVLGVAIIVTAFVFDRDESKLETDSGEKTTSSVTSSTTAPTATTTVGSESEETVTTTAPVSQEEIITTTTPVSQQETATTTTKKETEKTTTTTTTTKKPETTTSKVTTTTVTTTTKKPETTTTKPAQTNGSLEISASISNSWEEGGKKCSQVDVVIKNNSSSAKDGWSAVLNFSGNIEVSNGWNGTFSANGSTLTVTPAEYNSKIEPGSEVTFGVIVSGSGDVEISSATV